jgi:hypothetical protein
MRKKNEMVKGRKTGGRAWNFRDLTGQKFNRLTVMSLNRVDMASKEVHGRTFWNCICECGNEKVVESYNLTRGSVKSCGCLKKEMIHDKMFIDMTGQRFNRLFVESLAYQKDGKYYWNVVCDCGTKKVIAGYKLRTKNTQSCGCLQKENRLQPFGDATFNQIWHNYKYSSKNRNIDFCLQKDDVRNLIQQNCFYCGIEPYQVVKSNCNNGDTVYNGIDRIDSSKGYTLDNCVPCCGRCNVAKLAMPREEFLEWIERVYNYSIKNKDII